MQHNYTIHSLLVSFFLFFTTSQNVTSIFLTEFHEFYLLSIFLSSFTLSQNCLAIILILMLEQALLAQTSRFQWCSYQKFHLGALKQQSRETSSLQTVTTNYVKKTPPSLQNRGQARVSRGTCSSYAGFRNCCPGGGRLYPSDTDRIILDSSNMCVHS